jgi:hypothetical protein
MWIPDGEEVPTRPRRMIASRKQLPAVFWSPMGFSPVEILPKMIHFDSQHLCSKFLSAIGQNRPPETPEDRRRRMVVHFDDAIPHTANWTIDYLRAYRLIWTPHPAFSSDLEPSNFYMFSKLKMALMGAVFANDDELLQGVMEALNKISREEPEAIFEEWLLRLPRYIQHNGEYVE